MKYRKYGRHGIEVSEIGLGGHREGAEFNSGTACTARWFRPAEERAATVQRALDRGVTYFETTYGCEIESLGESLRICGADRTKIFISGMRVDYFKNLQNEGHEARAYVREEVLARLKEAQLEYLDQFMLGAAGMGDPLSTPEAVEETLAELEVLKEEGLIRYAGFSCHDPDYGARLLDAYPAFDAVMTPYNAANRTLEGDLTGVAQKNDTPLIAMKNLVWSIYGVPVTALTRIKPVGELAHDPDLDIASLALRFILQNQDVRTIVPAVNSAGDMDANADTSDAGPLSEAEQAAVDAFAASMKAKGSVPLAIAGLCLDNFRARISAIEFLEGALEVKAAAIDRSQDGAEEKARERARALIEELTSDAQWGEYADALMDRP